MSEILVEVVEQTNTVSTSVEEIEVEVSPLPASSVEISEDATSIAVSETSTLLEITEPAPIQIIVSEMIKDSGSGAPDITDIPLTISKIYAEIISALKAVTSISSTEVVKAEPDTFTNAKVLGITLNGGITGFEGELIILGVLADPSFNFPVNDLLYLGTDGLITNVAPALPTVFSTTIGHSLGLGSIFINLQDPIAL